MSPRDALNPTTSWTSLDQTRQRSPVRGTRVGPRADRLAANRSSCTAGGRVSRHTWISRGPLPETGNSRACSSARRGVQRSLWRGSSTIPDRCARSLVSEGHRGCMDASSRSSATAWRRSPESTSATRAPRARSANETASTTNRTTPRCRSVGVTSRRDSLTSPATHRCVLILAIRRTSLHACRGIVVRPTSRTTSSAFDLELGNGGPRCAHPVIC
jgi:hypothetical protein